jgi:hypothetical protein
MRTAVRAAVAVMALVAAACGKDSTVAPAEPELPGNPVIPPQYRGAAFIADISSLKKTVKITPPAATIRNPLASQSFARAGDRNWNLGGETGGTFQSLLGGDVIDLVATNYQAGALGAVVPGKILITFDVQVVNKLNSVNLIVPTFPTPPAGTTGVLMFPFEIGVTTTSGGVSVGGAGNEVIVSSPRGGAVQVSNDWDGNGTAGSGAPHNFFNDIGCLATSNDCFRWEEYAPIPALGSSSARSVGFLIDPTVGDFRVKMILAADLQNSGGAAQFGTIAGTVTSPQIGAISGASISVSGGFSGTTGAGGAYSITNIGVGSRTVSVSNLPSGCTAPASQTVSVTNGATSTANFSVTCTVPTGTVTGTINNSLGGVISGALVTLTPTGGSAQTFTTAAAGVYTFTVPVGAGTGSITVGNLPANCTAPAATPYSGLTSGGTVTANITVTCTPAPTFGTIAGTVTSSLGGGIAGASVVVTPTGGSAQPAVTTDGAGAYSRNQVPVGTGAGSVSVSNLPANCTAPAAGSYTGLTSGGTQTVNFVVTCTPAAFTYGFTGAQQGGVQTCTINTNPASPSYCPTGRYVVYALSIDMGAAPGLPDVNGANADQLVGVQANLGFNTSLVTTVSKNGTSPSADLDLATVGVPTPGTAAFGVTSSFGGTALGLTPLINLRMHIPATGTGSLTPTISFVEILVDNPTNPLNKNTSVTATLGQISY